MSAPQAAAPSLDRVSLRAARRGFYALNRQRLDRLRQGLRARQRVVADLLPLFFHVNHPLLPGYVSRDTPAGVSHYRPTREAVAAARHLARSFEPPARAPLTLPIQGVYVMGSMGTIAQSDRSDLDVWVCHDPQLDGADRQRLRAKAEAVSEWAATLDLDVHCFVIDPADFRAGQHEALSPESSGSLQPTLLLDEFYRTALLLAGRHPLWWMVPPSEEASYDACAHALLEQRFVRASDVIDFGGVCDVPAAEFLGAALWQTYKAVDAPYKSVLKLLLMESYAGQFPDTKLLSHRFKEAVYRGEGDADSLDPYILMAAQVEDHLNARDEPMRLELARRCLYYKVNRPIMRHAHHTPTEWRDELLARLVERWGWTDGHLIMLDTRSDWKIDRVIDERNLLADELNRSYQVLAEFARRHVPRTLEEGGDLALLTRKLQARLGRRAGKVELINPGVSADVRESHVIFERQTAGWSLLRGAMGQRGDETVLRRAHRLAELAAWCHFNDVVGPHTAVGARDEAGEPLDTTELREVLACLRQWFPDVQLADAGADALARAPATRTEAVLVNLGADPFAGLTRAGLQRTTRRTDALSFSGLWDNLVLSVDRIAVNTWHEVTVHHYEGADALADVLCDYLACLPEDGGGGPALYVHGFPAQRGPGIAARVGEVFAEARACFREPTRALARLVIGVGRGFYVVERTPEGFTQSHARSQRQLLERLAAPRSRFSPPVLCRGTLTGSPLGAILGLNRPAAVQLFHHAQGGRVDIYILDEHGSVFHDRVATHDVATVVNRYRRFLETVTERRRGFEAKTTTNGDEVLCYRLVAADEGYTARPEPGNAPVGPPRYLSVQVIAEGAEPGLRQVTVYCGQRPFSPLEYGERVFEEVVAYILAHRACAEPYPVYITDLDIAAGSARGKMPQTVELLRYKRQIEERLNAAVRGRYTGEVDAL